MGNFAIIVHPIEISDVYRRLKFLRRFPLPAAEAVTRSLPPFKLSKITGIQSPYGKTTGYFICCPLTSAQMVQLPQGKVIKKIIQAGRLAERLDVGIVGLGAMTALVGDAGVTLAGNLKIAVTTGNAFALVTALEAAVKAAEAMGMDPGGAEFVVVGAGMPAGSVVARLLARKVRFLTLFAENNRELDYLSVRILKESGLAVKITADIRRAVRRADILINVTGAAGGIIDVSELKPGAVVCDVTRPRDLARRVAELRDDVFAIEGALVEVPGHVDLGFNLGLPPGTVSAGMAETMMLALEDRYELCSLGHELSVGQADEIAGLARKHRFRVSGLRCFDRAVNPEQIAAIRRKAIRSLSRLQKE